MRFLTKYLTSDVVSTIQEFFWFGVAGAINAITYMVVSYLIFSYMSGSAIVATTLGYISAVIVSFVINATLVFSSGDVRSGHQALKFGALYLLGYIYNLLLIGVGSEIYNYNFGLMVFFVTITWPIFSFTISKFFVFR